MTPDQQKARINRLVSAAKALLTLQVGFTVGAIRIHKALYHLSHKIEEKHIVFDEFIKAIPAEIPLGNARLHWEQSKLMETDAKLAKIESNYREAILNECHKIIRIWGAD